MSVLERLANAFVRIIEIKSMPASVWAGRTLVMYGVYGLFAAGFDPSLSSEADSLAIRFAISLYQGPPIWVSAPCVVLGVVLLLADQIAGGRTVLVHVPGMPGSRAGNPARSIRGRYGYGLRSFRVDLRHAWSTGTYQPAAALAEIKQINAQISALLGDGDHRVFVAAIAPIPILMALGFVISSRSDLEVLEMNRGRGWTRLQDADDGEAIEVDEVGTGRSGVVRCVLSLSVPIAGHQVPQEPGDLIVQVRPGDGARSDSLASTEKQLRFATAIYNKLAALRADYGDIQAIEIYAACQASFAVRLGSQLSPTVLPRVIVRQFDDHSYTWGVAMDRSGLEVV